MPQTPCNVMIGTCQPRIYRSDDVRIERLAPRRFFTGVVLCLELCRITYKMAIVFETLVLVSHKESAAANTLDACW